MPARPSAARVRLFRVLVPTLTLAFAALVLAGAELAARRWSRVPPTAPWEQEHQRSMEALAARCEVPPPRPGARRVVVVGESSAAMLALALARLAERAPAPLQVVDCAQAGSTLEHLTRRYRDALDAGAESVVVLFGHNVEFVGEARPWALAARRLAQRSSLVRALTGAPSPAPERPHPERVAAFERWLDGAAPAAAARGVRLVLAVPAGNPWFAPPADASWQALTRARALLALGRDAEGRALLAATPGPAARYERALLAASARDEAGATAHLAESLAGSAAQTNRAPPALTAMLRRAARRHGLALVDAERLLAAWYPPAPDWRHFTDACHPSYRVLFRLARETAAAAAPGWRPAPGTDDAVTAALELGHTLDGLLALPPEDAPLAARTRALAAAVPQWLAAPEGEAALQAWIDRALTGPAPAAHRARVLAGLAHGYDGAGRPERARALYALSPAPAGPHVAAEWALWLARDGRVDEARRVLAPFASREPASWVARALAE